VSDTDILDALREVAQVIADADAAAIDGRRRRSELIRAADGAKIPREKIAAAAGLRWPVSRQRWSVLRRG